MPVCVHTKVSGRPCGSVPDAVSETGVPDVTVVAGMWFTVGASAALIVTVVDAVAVPPQFVTLTVSGTTVCAATNGAVAPASRPTGCRRKHVSITYAATASKAYLVKNFTARKARRPGERTGGVSPSGQG